MKPMRTERGLAEPALYWGPRGREPHQASEDAGQEGQAGPPGSATQQRWRAWQRWFCWWGPPRRVQGLRVRASSAGGVGSIPHQGTKTPEAARCIKKNKKWLWQSGGFKVYMGDGNREQKDMK